MLEMLLWVCDIKRPSARLSQLLSDCFSASLTSSHALATTADEVDAMEQSWADFTGRLPQELYRDALDLARVFNLSLSEWLATAVNEYVEAQLKRRVVSSAVTQIREARGQRSLANGPEERSGGGAK